ncbi:MAG: hypothetical protein WB952_06055 [Terriglobales bacterium]
MHITRSIRWLSVVLVVLGCLSTAAYAGVFVSVNVGPPALPVYEQPICPAPGYIWAPGYWSYGPDGYFWVPGTWVMAPRPGLLWTPGYWGWGGGAYLWHGGYWGPTVGFYGGINYGYGYGGSGYQGGYWRGRDFYYNQSVNHVNVTNIHNTYNTTVINNTTVNRVSYNGGTGGTMARPTAQEEAAARQPHLAPTAMQTQHLEAARGNRQLLASVNHGAPAIAATAKPAVFTGHNVVASKSAGAPYKAPTTNVSAAHTNASALHPATTPNEMSSHSATPRPPSTYHATTATTTTHPATTPHAQEMERTPPHPVTGAHPQPAPRTPPHPTEHHPQ